MVWSHRVRRDGVTGAEHTNEVANAPESARCGKSSLVCYYSISCRCLDVYRHIIPVSAKSSSNLPGKPSSGKAGYSKSPEVEEHATGSKPRLPRINERFTCKQAPCSWGIVILRGNENK